jgi:hypothetical protein
VPADKDRLANTKPGHMKPGHIRLWREDPGNFRHNRARGRGRWRGRGSHREGC